MEENFKEVVFDANGVIFNDGILDEDVFNIVKDLKKKNIKIFLCSNTSRRMFDIWDEKYDFLKYFDEVILSEDIQISKPEPEFFREILKRSRDILPQEILLIDDHEENVIGAEAEGMNGILFKDIDSLKKSLLLV